MNSLTKITPTTVETAVDNSDGKKMSMGLEERKLARSVITESGTI